MKVYLLFVSPLNNPEESHIYGVYSSSEKAGEARAEYMKGLEEECGGSLDPGYFSYIYETAVDEKIGRDE